MATPEQFLDLDAPADAQRRRILQLLGAGGLLLATGVGGVRRLQAAEAAAAPWSPLAYVMVHDDGRVTIICHRSEMGQGIRTTMPMIIADEMEADWSQCQVQQADGEEKIYGSQNTDGSTSIRNFLARYRETGATVRALMEDAAAKQWGVEVSQVKAHQHTVVHEASGRSLPFAALVASARTLPMPSPERIRIKAPAERRWQGKAMPSIDLGPMVSGQAVYGADVKLPGMLVAAIARPPVWGASIVSVDDHAALKVPGVKRVLRVPAAPLPGGFLPLGGVAVLATDTWSAIKGRDALVVKWADGANAVYDSKLYKAQLKKSVRAPGKAGRTVGDAKAALKAAAGHTHAAEYYMPHLSHGQLEPMVAIARARDGNIEAWAPTQSPWDARKTIAEYLKVDTDKVTVHVTLLGGAFGRKSKPDYICEAAWLAREAGMPVRVQWTRQDDLQHSYYHSVAAHRLEAAMDSAGTVVAWRHRSAYPPISATFAPDVSGPDPDDLTNGASDLPFAIPNISVEACAASTHARIGWFRSVNAIHHGFAIGSFVDELAHSAGKDPAQFWLALLGPDRRVDLSKDGLAQPASNYEGSWEDHPLDSARAKRVLQLAVEKSGWGAPLPKGRGRGIAMMRSFLSYVAWVVEVEVSEEGVVSVPRATAAVDAGFVANPDRARAQMEGALIMGMSNVLYSGITFAKGRVEQSNFHDYNVARLAPSPHEVNVHFVPSEGLPGGIGEPGVPPAGPAIMNAIFAATGVRVRTLPVGGQLAGWNKRKNSQPA
jgi:isoquinoline 1-oxidoreductase subunit beta